MERQQRSHRYGNDHCIDRDFHFYANLQRIGTISESIGNGNREFTRAHRFLIGFTNDGAEWDDHAADMVIAKCGFLFREWRMERESIHLRFRDKRSAHRDE